MSEEHGLDIVKWYTRARRFPQLIGRTPDGAKIPGGPYTVTQAVGAGLILIVGLNSMDLWARFGLIGNILVLATVTWTAVWLLGQIPVGSRNPLSVATGIAHAIGAPSTGRLAGRTVRIRRPHQLRHTVVLARTDMAPDVAVLQKQRAHASPTAEQTTPLATPEPRLPRFSGRQRPVEALAATQGPMSPPEASAAVLAPRMAPLTGVQALLANHPTTTKARTEMETSR